MTRVMSLHIYVRRRSGGASSCSSDNGKAVLVEVNDEKDAREERTSKRVLLCVTIKLTDDVPIQQTRLSEKKQ